MLERWPKRPKWPKWPKVYSGMQHSKSQIQTLKRHPPLAGSQYRPPPPSPPIFSNSQLNAVFFLFFILAQFFNSGKDSLFEMKQCAVPLAHEIRSQNTCDWISVAFAYETYRKKILKKTTFSESWGSQRRHFSGFLKWNLRMEERGSSKSRLFEDRGFEDFFFCMFRLLVMNNWNWNILLFTFYMPCLGAVRETVWVDSP